MVTLGNTLKLCNWWIGGYQWFLFVRYTLKYIYIINGGSGNGDEIKYHRQSSIFRKPFPNHISMSKYSGKKKAKKSIKSHSAVVISDNHYNKIIFIWLIILTINPKSWLW